MTKRRFVVLTLLILPLTVLAGTFAEAEQWTFTLSQGQSIAVGNYVIEFSGATSGVPFYNLYLAGGGLLVQFPSGPARPNRVYVHGNVVIRTSDVSADGSVATGVVAIR